MVFSSGRPSDAMYVIASGWVRLEETTSGGTLTLANLGAGSLLGEVDTLLGRPYSTSARAAANTQLLMLSSSDIQDLIGQYPSIGLKFSASLGMHIAYLEQYLVQQRLRNIELLSALSEGDLTAIAQKLDFRSFARGEFIVEAGSPGDAVCFIEEGQARLMAGSKEGDSFEDLEEGAIFGHTALVTGKPYSATIRAVTDVSVWMLTRTIYHELIREHPTVKLAFSRALAESLGPGDQNDAADRIRQLALFSDVPTEALSALVARLVLRHFPTGDVIYTEGTPGDALYVVESGEIKLMDSAFSDAQLLERVRSGESFGEMALLTGRTRAECARAASDTTLWVLYKSDFDDLMVQYPEISVSLSRALTDRLSAREDDFLLRHLRRITLFSSFASSELRAISKKVKGLRFRSGEIICFAGQPAQTLFMIEMGEVKRIGVGMTGEPVLIDLLGPGDSFGEQAIVQNSSYTTTAQAIGEVELWTIAKTDFDILMEQYPSFAVNVTRMMANRLSRNEGGMPGLRSTPPLPGTPPRAAPSAAPYGQAPYGPAPYGQPAPGQTSYGPASYGQPAPGQAGYGPASYGPAPRNAPSAPRPSFEQRAQPKPVMPPSRSRIAQPQSGARPVTKPVAMPARRYDQAASFSPPATRPLQQPAPPPTAQPTQPAYRDMRRPLAPTMMNAAPAGAAAAAAIDTRLPMEGARPAVRSRPRRARQNQFVNELIAWLGGLSWGARIRVALLLCLLAWIVFIAIPALAISTVTSTFAGLSLNSRASAASATEPASAAPADVTRTTSGGKSPKIGYAVATATAVPSKTPLPKPTATRPRATAAPPKPVATVAPPPPQATAAPAVPTLPPIYWDQRLGNGSQVLPHLDSVQLTPATVAHGQKFWRAISVKFEDITESGNDHTIYVKVLGEDGQRIDGKKAHLTSVGGLSEYPDEKPAGDMCDCNFNYPMYGDGYAFTLEDQFPSDKVSGMIMPLRRHVNYRVTFRLTTNP